MIYLASILSISPALVAAALYITSPTNLTVFHPSTTHANVIRWIDDKNYPSLSQLGNIRIDLILDKVSCKGRLPGHISHTIEMDGLCTLFCCSCPDACFEENCCNPSEEYTMHVS